MVELGAAVIVCWFLLYLWYGGLPHPRQPRQPTLGKEARFALELQPV